MEYYPNPPSLLMGLPDGIAGTRSTLFMMRDIIRVDAKTVPIRQLAVSLTQGLKQKDWSAEVAALFYFVRDKIRYIRDIRGTETLHNSAMILQNRAGDCDDKAILLSSLLRAIGYSVRLVAVGFKSANSCEHVFIETRAGDTGSWVALDPTMNVAPGWSPLKDRQSTKEIRVEI
jgi:transglutaminase-like putative cysteine protease